jgi:hypothetical protein
MLDHPLELVERLWSRMERQGDCLIWMWGVSRAGYGRLQYKGMVYYTNRLSYELVVGPIPEGKAVLPRCGNRRCCEPEHLYVGDRSPTARSMRASNHPWSGGIKGRVA